MSAAGESRLCIVIATCARRVSASPSCWRKFELYFNFLGSWHGGALVVHQARTRGSDSTANGQPRFERDSWAGHQGGPEFWKFGCRCRSDLVSSAQRRHSSAKSRNSLGDGYILPLRDETAARERAMAAGAMPVIGFLHSASVPRSQMSGARPSPALCRKGNIKAFSNIPWTYQFHHAAKHLQILNVDRGDAACWTCRAQIAWLP
jgi:hypothetical protein